MNKSHGGQRILHMLPEKQKKEIEFRMSVSQFNVVV